jgi:hypothetical protein
MPKVDIIAHRHIGNLKIVRSEFRFSTGKRAIFASQDRCYADF